MNLRPRLVIDRDTKLLCMELRLGEFVLHRKIPDYLATATRQQLSDFFEATVPDMTKELQEMQRNKLRLVAKEAK